MIQTYTAHTDEVDDAEAAVAEILEQLDCERHLLTHSVGILTCFSEFLSSGVVAALRARLPFPLLGMTTIANAVPHELGETMLCLMVMTSDDVSFAAGLTDDIVEEEETPLRRAYEQAAAKLPGKPSLMFSFAPLLFNVGGDFFVHSLDKISGGVPNFGALAVDHNEDYHDAQVIFDGEGYRNRYAFVLCCGELSPAFYVATISDEKILSEKGVVTAAAGNQLQAVNDMPTVDYLLSLGLTQNALGGIDGINAFPIIVDYNDGTMPVVRAMFALTPEGYAVCGGDIPVGSTLSIGEFDSVEIKATSAAMLDRMLAEHPGRSYLAISCVGRYFSLGFHQLDEVTLVKDAMERAGASYLFAYSGGEIAPIVGRDGRLSNRNHNNSLILCAL